MSEQKVHNVIIIGSGPAGLTAALYNARADLEPVVFEGPQPGGQLTITTEVENFPGFPEGIEGPEMMQLFRKQAERFGADCRFETVESVDFSKRPFRVTTEKGDYRGKSVIISTGASARWLDLPSEQEYRGRGVSACATCDGFFFKDKVIAVVGGGDTAMEEALFLTKFGSKVYVVHRRGELRASQIMADRALAEEKIEFIWDTVVTEVLGDGQGITGLRLENTETGEESTMEVGGLFIAIGHEPNTELFEGILEMNETGYLITDGVRTGIEGVYASGDVMDKVYRQAVTAAGTGCMAAIEAERWLAEKEAEEAEAAKAAATEEA
ncbi:MAG: thioredoxin-disulfide reductase [bacterium]